MKPKILSAPEVRKSLPRRSPRAHKGDNGHVLIVAGSRGMSGAAILSARGALRIGAGLVTVAIVEGERSAVTRQLPEALTLPLPETAEGVVGDGTLGVLQDYAEKRRINALAVGPGLSVDPAVARMVKNFLQEWEQPLVLDADGLNNIAPSDLGDRRNLIITPHAGELARLRRGAPGGANPDRVKLAEATARDYRVICVLKGHQSVISQGTQTRLNPTGNAAMATGGMGDVLTGAIAGLLAQNLKPWEAACAGVYLHGLAGDLAKVSDRGLLATDVADALPRALAKIGVK